MRWTGSIIDLERGWVGDFSGECHLLVLRGDIPCLFWVILVLLLVARLSQRNLNNKKAATKSPHRMNMTGKNFNNGQSPTAMVRYLVDPVPNFSQI